MGNRFPPLDRIQIESILKAIGFVEKRHEGTSHAQWEGVTHGQRRIVTVDHSTKRKEKYGKRLISNMIRQSGLSKQEFYSHL